ncbi:MAG: tetratricopeptide repeat protein [Planctomycetes bacterium]|nr:tetratricopeptide repeat protein [Planctomycetota bacterium]
MPTFAAFVHTDIQGSTRLWECLGHAFATILSDHNRLLRDAIAACGGTEIGTEGDSFTVGFSSADEAVSFALRAQESLHAHPWPTEAGEILVRIGVHAGEPCSRVRLVASAGHGGQIVVSGGAAEAAARSAGVLTPLGEHRLAPGDRPEPLLQLLPRALADRAFPPPRTLTVRPTNIPPAASTFVGRSREVAELREILPQPAGRLVTLTGPGGIGKTRLAQRAALDLVEAFEGGCWFADLSEARNVRELAWAVATALGMPLAGNDDPAGAIADVLEYRKPVLLVLDGFEALVEHAPATLGLWSRRARHARFLVTSLTLLGVSGEREVPVPPLPAPPVAPGARARGAAEVSAYDAVRLFVDRAAAGAHGFALTDANADAVAEICADLEGIPLAIELAAARMSDLGAVEMLRELRNQFQIRDTSPAGGARRRHTLQGALEWSYGLLSESQKTAFHQACIFRNGFFLEAAEDVVDLSACPDAPLAIDAVQALRDRSLVRTTDTSLGTRFSMFRSIREFGETRMAEALSTAERRALEERHARHFLEYGDLWRARLAGPEAAEAYDRLDMERENLCAVQDRVGERDPVAGARAALAMVEVLVWRGPSEERVPRLERALARLAGQPELEVRLRAALSDAYFGSARAEEAEREAGRALATAEASGVPGLVLRALLQAGNLRVARGDMSPALDFLTRGRDLARKIGDRALLSRALGHRANLLKLLGQREEALRDAGEGLDIARSMEDLPQIARLRVMTGTIHQQWSDYELALRCYDESEKLLLALGSRLNAAKTVGNRGLVLLELGQIEEAVVSFEQAILVHREMGHKPGLAIHIGNLGIARLRQGRFEDALASFEAAARLHADLGEPEGVARARGNEGNVMMQRREFEAAVARYREVAEEFRRLGLRNQEALYVGNLGAALIECGRLEEGRDRTLEGLAIWEGQGAADTSRAFLLYGGLAAVEARLGNRVAAERAARRALEVAAKLSIGEDHANAEIRSTLAQAKDVLKADIPPPPFP